MAVKFVLRNFHFSAYKKLSNFIFSEKNEYFLRKKYIVTYVYHCSQVLHHTERYFCYSGFRIFSCQLSTRIFWFLSGISIFKLPRNCSVDDCSSVVLADQVVQSVHDDD